MMAADALASCITKALIFNLKIPSYQYRKSHSGDKTVVRSFFLHNGISYTGKMASLYWISPQGTNRNDIDFAVKLVFVVCGKWFQLPTHLQWRELIENINIKLWFVKNNSTRALAPIMNKFQLSVFICKINIKYGYHQLSVSWSI